MTTQDGTYSGERHETSEEDAVFRDEPRDEFDAADREGSYADQHDTEPAAEHSAARSDRASGGGADTDTAQGSGDQATALIPADRVGEFKGRWTEMKGDFVDDPRNTLQKIDGLVGEVLDELNEMFKRQRSELEADLKKDEASTEDLRVAFGRYQEFFDRLLSF